MGATVLDRELNKAESEAERAQRKAERLEGRGVPAWQADGFTFYDDRAAKYAPWIGVASRRHGCST